LRAKAIKWDIIRSKREVALQEQQTLLDRIERAQRWFHIFSYWRNLRLSQAHVDQMITSRKQFKMFLRRMNFLKRNYKKNFRRRRSTHELRTKQAIKNTLVR
jgi:lysyl-tRNA synthetase class I